ncbi:ABC transporter substrate-binding protein [Embleya sp. NPDC005971]|uniref:ABC transporter substrate-binding protein n=1 Tax=unclassified Embleya TaxID=2699296 RepID=UPI0033F92453
MKHPVTRRRRAQALIGIVAVTALTATACGGGSGGSKKKYSPSNKAITEVVNQSSKKGGTLKLVSSDKFDSLDPGDMYYASAWNFSRLMARPLLTFKPAPGNASYEFAPDLATDVGKTDDGGKTWTYHLRKGVKYEDGTEVKASDVKYAVERTFDKEILPNGPGYFAQYLDPDSTYKGPYKDSAPDKLGLKAIETPDDYTIVFKMKEPFADFNYLAALPQTAPVPPAKDTGKEYVKHPLATGAYMVDGQYEPGKAVNLVRNPHWDPSTDPLRKALPDRIELLEKQDANDVDNRLFAGTAQLDVVGTGVQAAAQNKILTDEKLAGNSDDAVSGALAYLAISSKTPPFDNVHCRRAVQYAVNKAQMQRAVGGEVGADIATNLMPPTLAGSKVADMYPNGEKHTGDVAKAKDELKQCGKPDGFSTILTARSNRPKEVAGATSVQNALEKVGIKIEIRQYPSGDYFTQFAGVPKWVADNKVGIMFMQWGPDFPTQFGFFQQIVDGRAIKPAGGTNLSELNDPAVNGLIDQATRTIDPNASAAIWQQLDQKVMESAVMVPFAWTKSLLYRPPNVTNLVVTPAYSGMYDYLNIGIQ